MKLALLTHYVPTEREDYTELFKLTGPLRDEYCARHGYEHVVQRGAYGNLEYYAYQRLQLLRDLMDKPNAADVYWVANVQGIITSMEKRIDDVVDGEHEWFHSKDCHGVNLGSFVVCNTPFSREWLDFLIAQEPNYRNRPWKEQQAVMDWWLHEKFTWKIHLVPQRVLNSYQYWRYQPWPETTPGNWRKGDLFLNLPGMSLSQRLRAVSEILASDMILR